RPWLAIQLSQRVLDFVGSSAAFEHRQRSGSIVRVESGRGFPPFVIPQPLSLGLDLPACAEGLLGGLLRWRYVPEKLFPEYNPAEHQNHNQQNRSDHSHNRSYDRTSQFYGRQQRISQTRSRN